MEDAGALDLRLDFCMMDMGHSLKGAMRGESCRRENGKLLRACVSAFRPHSYLWARAIAEPVEPRHGPGPFEFGIDGIEH